MSSDVFSTFEDQVEARHNEMIADLESITVDDLKTEGVTISFGGKTFKFKDLEVIKDESVEDKIRKEFKSKLNTQQSKIREKINAKINQLLLMHQQKQEELTNKERQLKEKYKNSAMMPNISEKDYLRGLSVVKGYGHGELIWIYRATYNPKFIVIPGDEYRGESKKRKAIPSRLVSRCKKPMYIQLITKGDQITSVTTRKIEWDDSRNELPAFPHYHQTGTSDCWGSWSGWRNVRWTNPSDILRVAKDAEAVLETINQGSIANRGPAGLPRMQTLLDAVANVDSIEVSDNTRRRRSSSDDDDVWEI